MDQFEIRYLSITWLDRETVAQLQTSQDGPSLTHDGRNWKVETTTFPTIGHYIGLRTLTPVKHIPYLIRDNGEHEALIPIKQPGTEHIWWIQNSGWDEQKKRYLSELYRTAGRATLQIQQQTLIIENNPVNFSLYELEHYLADFKTQLWMLILDQHSALQADITKPTTYAFDEKAFALYHNFIQVITTITRKPSMQLMEAQGKMQRRHVRPVARTFREYAIRPNAKHLTSRIYQESYDTAENRYIHYCVQRIALLISGISNISHALYHTYRHRLKQETEKLATFKEQNIKTIDKEVFDREIDTIKKQIETNNKLLSALCYSNRQKGEYHGNYTVKIGNKYKDHSNAFFCSHLNRENFKKKHKTYLVITFPIGLNDIERNILQNHHITITGTFTKYKNINAKGNAYYQLNFITIDNIYVDKTILKKKLERRAQLAHNNWQAPFNQQELEERQNEITVMHKSIEHHKELCHRIEKYQRNLPTLEFQLNKLKRFFIRHSIQIRAHCPNSMIFVQNPSYAGAKSLFNQLINRNGLNTQRLNALVEIDSIGLVNIANLYEKWCLIHIINTLQHYRFKAEHNWQDKLITAVLRRNYNISINFSAPQRQQEIILTYEKELATGKRPDFVLDLITQNYTRTKQGWEFTGIPTRDRLVLDAKFRTSMTEEYLYSLVAEMYQTKNYSEDNNNRVFILHPAAYSIESPTSPLTWGRHCDYGQSKQNDKIIYKQTKPHAYGSIFISPSLKHPHSHDNLQRLIGLFLQQNSEILETADQEENSPPSWYSCCCMKCGNDEHTTYSVIYAPTKANNERWEIKCTNCGLLTIQSLCFNCKCTLFKNGYNWTYHRTRSEQVSNIICPNCESFL